jgi:general secretion pathway protein D
VPSAGGGLNLAAAAGGAGAAETTQVVYLRYASAPQLAKVLAPFIGPTSRVVAGPGGDTLLVSGSAMTRSSLIELIRSFDTDALAGRSYAIFPVSVADPDDVTNEVRSYVQTTAASGDGPVQVMTLPRINAVLVVTSNPNYLDQVGRFITQTNAVAGGNARRLHVYYVQNGTASDLASVLSKAFSPDSSDNQGNAGSVAPGLTPATVGSPSGSPDQSGQPTPTPASLTTSGTVTPSSSSLTSNSRSSFGSGSSSSSFGSQSSSRSPEPDTPVATKGIRFIPDKKNNALVIFATPAEYQVIEATLRKIDILPLQVMIDATIAEVTLNDNLEYGTQFFFKNGATRTTLSNADNGGITPAFPGFAFAFTTQDAQAAISALQSVTKVKVVSDPQLLVLNNESARLQVGDLVPVTTQSAVSTTTAGAPVVNSIEYKETGVILEVTPRVNSGGLVTLDIQQEVSDVVKTSTSNIDSPTIQQRKIKTRIVSQNGETIGLGGLIKDSDNVGNSGVPWLTDIPVLGALFGTRSRFAARTELLILLTPHVIQDQRTARALTEDLQEKLGSLSAIPIKRDPIEPPGPLRQ